MSVNPHKKRSYKNSECNYQNSAKRFRINGSPVPYQVKVRNPSQPFQFNPNAPFLQKHNDLGFDNFQFGSGAIEDVFNQSSDSYEDLKDKSTSQFRSRHLISEDVHRKRILNFSRKLLGKNRSYRGTSFKVFQSHPFLQDILHVSGKTAQERFGHMLHWGFFPPSKRNTRNTIILSRKDGIVLHIARLKESMFDFNLIIEAKPSLMGHLGKQKKTGKINHYSAKNLRN